MILEFYNFINTLCFFDFDSMSSINMYSIKSYKYVNLANSYLFLLFYYIVFFFSIMYMLILRYFFSYGYTTQIHVDYNVNNKSIDNNAINICALYIISSANLYITQYTIYIYFTFLYLNITITYSMIVVFYNFTIFFSNKISKYHLLLFKNVKYLHNLNTLFSFCLTKNIFSNLTFIHILVYILFIINVLGNMIKDFNFINFILNFYNTTIFFAVNCNNFNEIKCF